MALLGGTWPLSRAALGGAMTLHVRGMMAAEQRTMRLSMELEATHRVPLTDTAHGVVLVEGTRVPLDTVVEAFNEGQSAEEILLSYPTLDLANLYAVLAYYLRHREDVDTYVAQRRQEAKVLRARIESRLDPQGIRDRLLARRPAERL